MSHRSIHAKVVALQSVLMAAVLAISSVVIYQRAAGSLRQALDTAIRCQADYACHVLRTAQGRTPAEVGPEIVAHPDLPPESRIVRILSPEGEELYASRHGLHLPKKTHEHADEGLPVFERVRAGRSVLRVATIPAVVDGRITAIVQVATATDELRGSLARLRWLLALVSLAALLVAAAGGRYLSSTALQPVARMTEMVRSVGIDNLEARVPVPATGDEVERLGDTFNGMLTRIERAVGQMHRFTADASHELRTPLTAIKGELEVALRRPRSREELEEVLRSALEEARHMAHVVDKMLILARADSGETPLARQPISLRRLAEQVVEHRKPLADAAGCHLSVAPGVGVTLAADAHYLFQLLDNLVDNAVQHSRSGGQVTIAIDTERDDAMLTVADDGEGVPPENLDRIFDRFFTARTTSKRGTGLGLSICQWIAHAHGGDIRVESRLGAGTTFTVRLPR